MFALDNLVKSAVQAGIMILSPELGANLAGHERIGNLEEEEDEDLSASGVSIVHLNKIKSKLDEKKYFSDEISVLRVESARLMRDLIESHKNYQNMLKSTIEEQNLSSEIIKKFSKQLSSVANVYQRNISQGYFSDISEPGIQIKISSESTPPSPVPEIPTETVDGTVNGNYPLRKSSIKKETERRINFFNETTLVDQKLNEWLIRCNVDPVSRNLILDSAFIYEDFLYEMTKDDLCRIGLKCGVEVKIWRSIKRHREQFRNIAEEFASSNLNYIKDVNKNREINKTSPTNSVNSSNNTDDVTGSDYESCSGLEN